MLKSRIFETSEVLPSFRKVFISNAIDGKVFTGGQKVTIFAYN